MSMWYYDDGMKRIGPLNEDQFSGLVDGGTIRGETLVWHQDLPKWMPYRDVPNGQGAGAPAPPLETGGAAGRALGSKTERCSECGRPYAIDDLVRFNSTLVCAGCKPIFMQRLREGVALPGQQVYGGFWIRGGAKWIDGIILFIVNAIVGMILSLFLPPSHTGQTFHVTRFIIDLALQFAVSWGYATYLVGAYGATLGKMACGLKVINTDGSALTYGKAFKRCLAELVSGITLGIGYIMAAFDDEKRALHDRIVDTRVVKSKG